MECQLIRGGGPYSLKGRAACSRMRGHEYGFRGHDSCRLEKCASSVQVRHSSKSSEQSIFQVRLKSLVRSIDQFPDQSERYVTCSWSTRMKTDSRHRCEVGDVILYIRTGNVCPGDASINDGPQEPGSVELPLLRVVSENDESNGAPCARWWKVPGQKKHRNANGRSLQRAVCIFAW